MNWCSCHQEFINRWNNHPLSSQHNQSPLQSFTSCTRRPKQRQLDEQDVGDFYGVDEDGPLADLHTSNHAVVPDLSIQVDNGFATEGIDVLADDGNHGIDIYLQVRNHVRELLG